MVQFACPCRRYPELLFVESAVEGSFVCGFGQMAARIAIFGRWCLLLLVPGCLRGSLLSGLDEQFLLVRGALSAVLAKWPHALLSSAVGVSCFRFQDVRLCRRAVPLAHWVHLSVDSQCLSFVKCA